MARQVEWPNEMPVVDMVPGVEVSTHEAADWASGERPPEEFEAALTGAHDSARVTGRPSYVLLVVVP